MSAKPLFVQYCAADFLADTVTLSPLAELAYRRICDLIYNSGDRLADDDSNMPVATKVGNKWPAVKRELIREKKIIIEGGFIRIERCTKECAKALGMRDQRTQASHAAAEKRKALRQQQTTTPSGTPSDPSTDTPTGTPGDTPSDPPGSAPVGPSPDHLADSVSVNGDPDNLPTVKLVGDNVLLLCGVEPESWQHGYQVVGTWLNKGADPVLDIYPTVKTLVTDDPEFEPPRNAGGLKYFTAAIARAMAERVSKDNGSELSKALS